MADQAVLEGFNAKRATVGKTGAIRVAKVGTEPRTKIEKFDPSVHRNLGYIGPDGVEISFDDDTEEWIPWQEANPIRKDLTKSVKAFKFTLWEISKENLAYFLGVPESEIKSNGEGGFYFDEEGLPEFEHHQMVLDMIDGSRKVEITGYDAQVTERGSITFTSDEMFSLEVTVSTYPASEEDYKDLGGKSTRWIFEGFDDEEGSSEVMILTQSLYDGTEGEDYQRNLTANGGSAPYEWKVDSGDLPGGLDLSESGQISGEPEESGEFTFTVKATDQDGKSSKRELTIVVSSSD